MFSSPIGESIFSTFISIGESKFRREFSSPIGESIFSTQNRSAVKTTVRVVLVPYRGIYFLYASEHTPVRLIKFSSPIGESIFSTNKKYLFASYERVLVPYRGIYFLYRKLLIRRSNRFRSRPLSGNLFSLRE